MAKRNTISQSVWYTKSYIFLILCVILSAALYSSVFNNGLHFDDTFWNSHSIILDSKYSEVHTINLQRTVPFMSFAIQYDLHGTNFSWYYIFNVLIHGINAFFVFLLIKTIFRSPMIEDKRYGKYSWQLAIAAGLLFLTHPLMTQAVAYIYQRLASLAALTYLGTLYFYAEARLGGNRNRNLLFAALFFLIGLFTKENVYTLPIMIVLFEVFFVSGLSYIKTKRFYILISIVTAMFALAVYSMGPKIFSFTLPYYDGTTLTPMNYLMTQFSVLIEYIRMLFLPINQNLDYEYTLAKSILGLREIITLLLNVLIIFAGIKLFKKYKLLSFAIFWFYLTLSVESSIIPIKDVINEHRLYLPMFGFVLFVLSASLSLIKRNISPIYLIVGLLVVVYSGMTINRLSVWENEYTLWNDVVTKSPNKSRGYLNRGTESNRMGNHREAYADILKAEELDSSNPLLYLNKATILFALKDYQGALESINKYLRKERRSVIGIQTRAHINFALGDYQSSIKDYSEFIDLKNSRNIKAQTYINRGISYAKSNKIKKAIKDIDKAIELGESGFELYQRLGDELFRSQDYSKAVKIYNIALRYNDRSHDTYNNIGTSYFFLKNYDKATEYYAKAIELKPDFDKAYINLGMVLNADGRFNEAIEVFDRLLEKKPDHPQSLFYKANAYRGLNMEEKAVEILQYAINKYPKFDQAKSLLDTLSNYR